MRIYTAGVVANLISAAVQALREGRDVVVVAHPAAQALAIADELVETALAKNVACVLSERRNGPERYEPIPLVMIRPFGWAAEETPMWRTRPIVLFDQSAEFERQHCFPPAVRTVFA